MGKIVGCGTKSVLEVSGGNLKVVVTRHELLNNLLLGGILDPISQPSGLKRDCWLVSFGDRQDTNKSGLSVLADTFPVRAAYATEP